MLLLLAMAALAAPAAAVPYVPEPPFCKQTVVEDPLAPIKRMPELHEPSAGGQIGFGPSSLRLRTTPSFRVGGGEVGFSLGLAQRKGLSLPWTGKATLVAVNGYGRPIGEPRRSAKKIGWLKPRYARRFRFEIPDDPGFYRTTLLLTGASGEKLGKFSFYTRVAEPVGAARLALDAQTYRPGSTLFFRVENVGTLTAFYGVPYTVEKLEGGSWSEAPESPRGPTILIGISSPPGVAGRCFSFWVPPAMAVGMYRVSKEIDFLPLLSPGEDRRQVTRPPSTTLTAEFQVVP
ncbi:MAG TPA: immunoglobulin-like domain-containing protein [Solirubrobacterales bacterium]|nr:immunoglobulin-like domain-containing protein [Solirubrobacterales bacterium]